MSQGRKLIAEFPKSRKKIYDMSVLQKKSLYSSFKAILGQKFRTKSENMKLKLKLNGLHGDHLFSTIRTLTKGKA